MGPELFWWGGWSIFFHRHAPRYGRCSCDHALSMEVLKKRYAKGETTRDEFEQVKKDLQS